MLISPFNTM